MSFVKKILKREYRRSDGTPVKAHFANVHVSNEQVADSKVKASGASMGLHNMAAPQTTRSRSGFYYKYSIGEPVELKAERLDTEISWVDFTEDLVLGFNDEPSPTTEQEA
jgi:hypothetical protein